MFLEFHRDQCGVALVCFLGGGNSCMDVIWKDFSEDTNILVKIPPLCSEGRMKVKEDY